MATILDKDGMSPIHEAARAGDPFTVYKKFKRNIFKFDTVDGIEI